MGIHPQNIGKTMDHGFAGSYARQPDMIVGTRPAGGADQLAFGVPLKYDADGAVVLFGAGSTAAQFVGVASREIKSSLNYLDQGVGSYAPGEAVSVFQRGCINVKCYNGVPVLNGPVFVRITANSSFPTSPVGGFETSTGTAPTGTVQLTNCKWAGPADANGIAEIRIMTIQNAYLDQTASFVVGDIQSVRINGSITITALSRSTVGNMGSVGYRVLREQTEEVSLIELLDKTGTVLASSAVYVPIAEETVAFRHAFTVKEGA